MSQRDRHIIDIVANTKANLPLQGTLDIFQSGFTLDGFMGFRWSNDLTEKGSGVHIFPSEETNTKFNRLGLFTGTTGIGILSPLTSHTKFLGITLNGQYQDISYIEDVGFNDNGDFVLDTCLQTPCIYSNSNLTLESKNSNLILKTSDIVTVNNGNIDTIVVQSNGTVLNNNINTDLNSYSDTQFVTANAIKAAITSNNPSIGSNGTLNVAKGDDSWETRNITITEDGSNVNIISNKTWLNLEGQSSVSIKGIQQTLNITGSIVAPLLTPTNIESDPQSLVTYAYTESKYGGTDSNKVLINHTDSVPGFIGDTVAGDGFGKIQAGDGINVTVVNSATADYKLLISTSNSGTESVINFDPHRTGFEHQNEIVAKFDDVTQVFTLVSNIDQRFFSNGLFTDITAGEIFSADLPLLGFVNGTGRLFLHHDKTFSITDGWEDDACPVLVVFKESLTNKYVFATHDYHGISMDSATKKYINQTDGAWIYDGVQTAFSPSTGLSVYPSSISNDDTIHKIYSNWAIPDSYIHPKLVYLTTNWDEYETPEYDVMDLTGDTWWDNLVDIDNKVTMQDTAGGLTTSGIDESVWYYIFIRPDARANVANESVQTDPHQFIIIPAAVKSTNKFSTLDKVSELFGHYHDYIADMKCLGAINVSSNIDYGDYSILTDYTLNQLMQGDFSSKEWYAQSQGDAGYINISNGSSGWDNTLINYGHTYSQGYLTPYFSGVDNGIGLHAAKDAIVMFEDTPDAIVTSKFSVNAGYVHNSVEVEVLKVNGLKRVDEFNGIGYLPKSTVIGIDADLTGKAIATKEWVQVSGGGASEGTNKINISDGNNTWLDTNITITQDTDSLYFTTYEVFGDYDVNISGDGSFIASEDLIVGANTNLDLIANTLAGVIRIGVDLLDPSFPADLIIDKSDNTMIAYNLDTAAINLGGYNSLITKGYADTYYTAGGVPSVGTDRINISGGVGNWLDTNISVTQDTASLYFTTWDILGDYDVNISGDGSFISHSSMVIGSDSDLDLIANMTTGVIRLGVDLLDPSFPADLIIDKSDNTMIAYNLDTAAILNGGYNSIITKGYADANYGGGGVPSQGAAWQFNVATGSGGWIPASLYMDDTYDLHSIIKSDKNVMMLKPEKAVVVILNSRNDDGSGDFLVMNDFLGNTPFEVKAVGLVNAPSLTTVMLGLESSTSKCLITKEYAELNYLGGLWEEYGDAGSDIYNVIRPTVDYDHLRIGIGDDGVGKLEIYLGDLGSDGVIVSGADDTSFNGEYVQDTESQYTHINGTRYIVDVGYWWVITTSLSHPQEATYPYYQGSGGNTSPISTSTYTPLGAGVSGTPLVQTNGISKSIEAITTNGKIHSAASIKTDTFFKLKEKLSIGENNLGDIILETSFHTTDVVLGISGDFGTNTDKIAEFLINGNLRLPSFSASSITVNDVITKGYADNTYVTSGDKVLADINDSTEGYLNDKVIAGTGITVSIDETDVNDHKLLIVANDDITDLSIHEVIELDDVMDAGSGYITTDAERTRWDNKTDKVAGVTLNDIAALNSNGNLIKSIVQVNDTGSSSSDLWTAEKILLQTANSGVSDYQYGMTVNGLYLGTTPRNLPAVTANTVTLSELDRLSTGYVMFTDGTIDTLSYVMLLTSTPSTTPEDMIFNIYKNDVLAQSVTLPAGSDVRGLINLVSGIDVVLSDYITIMIESTTTGISLDVITLIVRVKGE